MFDDIILLDTFISDYDRLPVTIKRRVDRRVHDWAIVGSLPRGAQSHRAYKFDVDIWIVYISGGHGAYRMLVEIKDRILYLIRVGDHEYIGKQLNSN